MNNNVFYKTRVCKQFSYNNFCPYGYRCQYLHNSNDKAGQRRVFLDKVVSILTGNQNLSLESVLESISANTTRLNLFRQICGEEEGLVRI